MVNMIRVLRNWQLIDIPSKREQKGDIFYSNLPDANEVPTEPIKKTEDTNIKENKDDKEAEEDKTSILKWLREEYEKVYGKKPFWAWKEDKLIEMIEKKQ